MTIQNNLTYNDIVTVAQNFLQNNCRNISGTKYDSLASCFKDGYSITPWTYSRLKIHGAADVKITRSCPSITSTQITNDLNAFVRLVLGSTPVSNICPKECFLGFVNNIVAFLAHRLFYCISQYSTDKLLIYRITDTVSTPFFDLKTKDAPIVTAYEVNSINNCLTDLSNMEIRNYQCLYEITMRWWG